MTLEVQRVSGPSENGFGSLSSCFVEGDPQSEKRARRIKHRAVAISIALQSIVVGTLILFPLLSNGERMTMQIVTPVPPYRRGNLTPTDPGPHHKPETQCHICAHLSVPNRIVTQTTLRGDANSVDPIGDTQFGSSGDPNGNPFGVEDLSPHRGPERPVEDTKKPTDRQRVSELQQMAQLIHRVEPIYPPLAKQIHHEGRVELRAIISTTGTIESLEVISGDPLLIQSALAAVREWRYRPTILNGRPIEVDTHITVIYTLSH
jgi:TonB family protein